MNLSACFAFSRGRLDFAKDELLFDGGYSSGRVKWPCHSCACVAVRAGGWGKQRQEQTMKALLCYQDLPGGSSKNSFLCLPTKRKPSIVGEHCIDVGTTDESKVQGIRKRLVGLRISDAGAGHCGSRTC